MDAPNAESLTAHYLAFFGNKHHSYVDLLPQDGLDHLSLEAKLAFNPEDFDKYIHPCWCNAELIYADDKRGNEVWLHKRVQ